MSLFYFGKEDKERESERHVKGAEESGNCNRLLMAVKVGSGNRFAITDVSLDVLIEQQHIMPSLHRQIKRNANR